MRLRYRTLLQKLLLWLCVVACFYGSLRCLSASIPYVCVVSSNPHPSDMARFWAARYGMYSRLLFRAGLSFTMLLLASYVKRRKLP